MNNKDIMQLISLRMAFNQRKLDHNHILQSHFLVNKGFLILSTITSTDICQQQLSKGQ